MVKTKIIATIGPASSNQPVLRKMILSGLDVIRLNFSHGSHKNHIEIIRLLRSLNKKMRRAIKIMQDLEGYRIRVGKLEKSVYLKRNSNVFIVKEKIKGNNKEFSFDYTGSLKLIKSGSLVYIDDGKMLLRVTQAKGNFLKLKVLAGGILKEKKGINIIGVDLPFDAVTQKDRKDIKVGIENNVDYIAQSFVRSAKDIISLKNIISSSNAACEVFAKIENQQALSNLDEIIKTADGIIVARGDLGICLPIYKVPVFQKDIIKRCAKFNKPVVVATQMLESMTENKLPTRAEVSDVANAIFDGANFLLLSGETAVGRYPDRVVDMMNKVIKEAEEYAKKI